MTRVRRAEQRHAKCEVRQKPRGGYWVIPVPSPRLLADLVIPAEAGHSLSLISTLLNMTVFGLAIKLGATRASKALSPAF